MIFRSDAQIRIRENPEVINDDNDNFNGNTTSMWKITMTTLNVNNLEMNHAAEFEH